MIPPEIDILSSISFPQSESAYPTTSLPVVFPRQIPVSRVPFKYPTTLIAVSQCVLVGADTNFDNVPTANDTSGLVHTAKNNKELTIVY